MKPGIHHKMQRGSIALAASALPISSVSQPKEDKISVTVFLASSSLPQINIVGVPAGKFGLYM